jgi:hypothetical protein
VCRSVDGGPEYCNGGFAQCTDHEGADTTCTPVEWDTVEALADSYCHDNPRSRYTLQFEVDVVDLSDPGNPGLTPPLTLPIEDEGVNVATADGDLYVTVKHPATVPGDARPYARYFIRRVDLDNPSQPALGPAINVPGELLEIKGNKLFTRDRVWGDQFMETAVASLKLHQGRAHLQHYLRMANRRVHAVAIDDGKRPLVTHTRVWQPYSWYGGWDSHQSLTILDPAGKAGDGGAFEALSDNRLLAWASLRQVTGHRAMFDIDGGQLMINVEDPEQPFAQAYFPSWWYGTTDALINGDEILVVGRQYGIHELDLDATNLPLAN